MDRSPTKDVGTMPDIVDLELLVSVYPRLAINGAEFSTFRIPKAVWIAQGMQSLAR